MFGNFIYFIVALLIYTTYQPSDETNFTLFGSLGLCLFLTLVFAQFTRSVFRKLEYRILQNRLFHLDHRFDQLVTRQSILAVTLFAIAIYGLNLPSFFVNVPLFRSMPTLLAILFLALFVFFLSIVWAGAYRCHRLMHRSDVSLRSYVVSNIMFSAPVLLPWVILSGVLDVIYALPFEGPKRLLATPEGEIAYFLLFLTTVAVLAPVLIQWFWRCHPLEDGDIRHRIEAVCRMARLKYSDILYWPIFGGRMITAGVMGLVGRFRYILVTGGLLKQLAPEEIDAVIAHEIGHVKRYHLLFYLFFFVGYLLVALVPLQLIIIAVFYVSPSYYFIEMLSINQTTILNIGIILLFLVYFRLIFGYFMRNFERQTDTYVYELFNSATPLISTFQKIVLTTGQSPDKPNWHHFSIRQRIDYLKKCEADRSWVKRHDRKVKKSIALYVAVILIFGGIGYSLNFGESDKRIDRHFRETMVQRELQRVHRELQASPENADLHRLLGDLTYEAGELKRAIDAYGDAIRLAPNDATAINNLAWLLATSEDTALRKPATALELALRAATLDPAPHILDTLAESYFINGHIQKAIEIEALALKKARKGRAYYEGQIRKFKEFRAKEKIGD
ncbi:hypothetical protein D3OALGA1CA_5653 [Olavius algarvensis associated proteobacterium Delta 3]|nr:hypothetical protein D3OALGA1CA_5653 [Olavius algarvensis associated proteobacterium Delta 3]